MRQVGQVGRVRQVGRVGGMGRLGGLRRLGVRAKASECMELGMWDEWDGERIVNSELGSNGSYIKISPTLGCNYELSIECRASSKRVR